MAGGVVVSDVGTTDRQVLYARTVACKVPCYTTVSVDNTRVRDKTAITLAPPTVGR